MPFEIIRNDIIKMKADALSFGGWNLPKKGGASRIGQVLLSRMMEGGFMGIPLS